jgi:hypothetical protein
VALEKAAHKISLRASHVAGIERRVVFGQDWECMIGVRKVGRSGESK